MDLRRLKKLVAAVPGARSLAKFLVVPVPEGAKLTPRRLLNTYLVRFEQARGQTKLRGYPIVLTVEPTNVCNLRCPACFTGAGEVGRTRSFLPLDFYRRLLTELGPYLLRLEFYNWGEPLLSKDVYTMVAEAKRHGISTGISTNFSVPFDGERAERLVASGLDVLGVSLDGATQAGYEKYRVRGDLERVLENCRLVADAKRRLGSKTPRLVWEYHVFEHNAHEVEAARAMAAEIGMDFACDKGWVVGPEWDPGGQYDFFAEATPDRCDFLWKRAVVQNDGGVSACCGTFYREDDYARLALSDADAGARSFREAWNSEAFQAARRFFRRRDGTPAEKALVCYDCPATVTWERYQEHRAAGGQARSFDVGYTANDSFNYFFNRRPERATRIAPGDLIDLQPVDAATPPVR